MRSCNFCGQFVIPPEHIKKEKIKGVENDLGYIICEDCIKSAVQAINDPEMAETKIIYLKAYQQHKAFSK